MAKKYFAIFSMLSAFILGVVFFPERVQAEELDSCTELICEWVEQYYRNMDLDETYDISCCFSEDILPLLEAKIEMGAFRRQTLGLQYRDYNITVHPISQEGNDTETNMRLQVKREWYYNENSDPSGITEVLEVTAKVDESGEWKIIGCYDEFESLIYGPIDELYRNAQTARGTTDISDLLGAYVSDYQEGCIEKGIQMADDMQNCIQDDKIESREKTSLSRSEIKSWARANFDKESPESSDSSICTIL